MVTIIHGGNFKTPWLTHNFYKKFYEHWMRYFNATNNNSCDCNGMQGLEIKISYQYLCIPQNINNMLIMQRGSH